MTCEKAESYLSAYLDDMLDPQLRQEVAAHVEQCAHCAEVLADYRRGDALLAGIVRVAPPDYLRNRLFESPEFAALLRDQPGVRGGRTSVPLLERPAPLGAARTKQGDEPAEVSAPVRARHRGTAPRGRPAALQSAAVLALLLGSALLIKQGLLHSGGSTGQGPQTLGGHSSSVPLAAGPRAVYLRSGALWSAPGQGQGFAQRLTPAGVRVAGWAVAPNGRTLAYVNAADGSIHIIRSDDQNDRTLAATSGTLPAGFWTSTAGSAVANGLSWSPGGTRLAYVAADGSGQTVLRIVNADGSGNASWGSAAAWTGAAVWSADGAHLAFAQSDKAGSQSLSVYDSATSQAFQLGAADPTHAGATFGQIAWLSGTSYPSLTWSATANGSIVGIFTQQAASGTTATLESPAGATYSAADFTAAHGADEWLVAGGRTLTTLPVGASSAVSATTPIAAPVTHVVWSPSGATAAYVLADERLGLWTPGATLGPPITSAAVGIPIWSPDGTRLATQVSDGVISVRVASGSITRYAAVSGVAALAWSPDSRGLAIGSASGVSVMYNGTVNLADTRALVAGAIRWTLAG